MGVWITVVAGARRSFLGTWFIWSNVIHVQTFWRRRRRSYLGGRFARPPTQGAGLPTAKPFVHSSDHPQSQYSGRTLTSPHELPPSVQQHVYPQSVTSAPLLASQPTKHRNLQSTTFRLRENKSSPPSSSGLRYRRDRDLSPNPDPSATRN